MKISNIKWDAIVMHPDIIPIGFSQFACVTALVLFQCMFRNFHQIQCLICALPQLRVARLRRLSFGARFRAVSAATSSPPPLTDVTVVAVNEQLALTFLEWLASTTISSLRSFESDLSPEFTPHVGAILEAARTSLQHLDFYFDGAFSPSTLRQLNLHRCNALQSLGLRRLFNISLPEVLRLIHPESHVRKLTINLWPGKANLESESAVTILGEEHFLALQRLELVFMRNIDTEEVKKGISDSFDVVRRRGTEVHLYFR
ncbi:hypothetical protein SCP_1900070 [Sparassis crispa]|uniref:F-box domain-containing protein n=1 Tax=Sparassis crispa TaxID=139825 RepID=A0A401H6T0_9APHY|nr:hypothetical protein SCP_1900070 [Sparassis crispa]GBE90158.1 hypothetical protein SCP_1900070 [Sparassis crispa]